MNFKLLDTEISKYENQIRKMGDLKLLSEVKKAQEAAKIAAKKARDLYKVYLKNKD